MQITQSMHGDFFWSDESYIILQSIHHVAGFTIFPGFQLAGIPPDTRRVTHNSKTIHWKDNFTNSRNLFHLFDEVNVSDQSPNPEYRNLEASDEFRACRKLVKLLRKTQLGPGNPSIGAVSSLDMKAKFLVYHGTESIREECRQLGFVLDFMHRADDVCGRHDACMRVVTIHDMNGTCVNGGIVQRGEGFEIKGAKPHEYESEFYDGTYHNFSNVHARYPRSKHHIFVEFPEDFNEDTDPQTLMDECYVWCFRDEDLMAKWQERSDDYVHKVPPKTYKDKVGITLGYSCGGLYSRGHRVRISLKQLPQLIMYIALGHPVTSATPFFAVV